MKHVGFTGTQEGMTRLQAERVAEILEHWDFWGHHGCCVGADAQFDAIARCMKGFRWMYIYPSDLTAKQAVVQTTELDIVFEPKPPLARNPDIVDGSDVMIATPKEPFMQLRSGTWSTIRYTRKVQKPLHIILPNGAWIQEGVTS